MLKGIHKRKRWENSGAAEIIGNILILGITVVLFSTLISFVGMMPTPEQNTYTAFSTSFGGYDSTGSPSYLNITPTGGDELEVAYTSVYVYVNGVGNQLDFSKSLTNVSGTWRVGQTLSYPLGAGTFTIKPGDSIRIMIIDETRNQIVWSAQQIMGVGEGSPIFKARWVDSDPNTPDIQSVARGDQFTIYAAVMDPDDDLKTDSVYANLSEFGAGYGPIRMWDNDSDGVFEAVAITPSNIPYGYYTITFNASDELGNTATSRYEMAVGGELADYPNLVILPENIEVSPTNPVRGSTAVTVTVRVTNYGKEAAAFTLTVEHNSGSGWSNISSPLTGEHIAGGQSLLLTLPWDSDEVGPSGNHSLRATATVTTLPDDSDYSDNSATTYVTVLPKILLVDDDGYNDQSNLDTTRFIGAALQSCNFDYTLHRVTLQNGPGYNTGEDKMMDYDIVIWNTGHTTSPLTSTDESNLIQFLTDTNSGKKLWMVGEDIVGNVSNTFLNDYLHAAPDVTDAAPTGMYYGLSGTFLQNTNFTVIERSGAPNSGDVVTPVNSGFALTADGSGDTTSVAYSGSYKVAFFPFDFSAIQYPVNQTEVAYQVIKWLASIDFIYGEDLAISQQSLSPSNPYYKQDITIKAVVRNNGHVTENTNVEFRIVTTSGQITVTTDDFQIPPHTSVEVNTTWEANTVGQVSIVAKVDPMNIIKETNELNNQVSSLLSSTSLYIKYRILLVDDDDSANNGGTNPTDSAQYMAEALDYAGIDFERNNVTHDSRYTGSIPLTKYNAVIWMTGEENANTLLNDDIDNITSFLETGGSLWLIGQGIEDELGGSAFMTNYIGISGQTLNAGAGPVIYGSSGENMMHGLRDNMTALFSDGTDYLTPASGAEAILWADSGLANAVGVENHDTTYGYTTFFMSVDFSFVSGSTVNGTAINGTVARAEIAYRALRGFGMPDSRIELYCTVNDLSISNAHPQLGRSYVLTAQVRNMGGTPSSALVRFMDGTHQVGSDSIYVQPGEASTAEVVWTPLYAGERTIQVLVDPIYEVNEIFRFNDNPSKRVYVYFFWDDMENGTSMWSHESTIMLINGENALDYFDSSTTLYTDVVQDWDTAESVGLQQNTSTYHTYDSCYQLEESRGGAIVNKADAIIGLVIDNSPSMTDRTNATGTTYLDVAKQAALNMIDGLSDASYVGVYDFQGANENRVLAITSLAGSGRNTVINAIINGVSAAGNTNTVIWDTIGMAYMDVNASFALHPDLMPAVVALSDGADYQAADSSAFKVQSIEAGSDEWAPWGDMEPENGFPTQNYPDHWGKYWFYKDALPGQWIDAGTHGGAYVATRKGLLHSDMKMYTIGLALEHYVPPDASGIPSPPPEYTQDYNTHVIGTESGTVEYNLWRIANTSGAEYYYTDNPDDLGDIFTRITQDIVSGSNQTRAASSGNTISAVSDNNYNKTAVTPSFDLRHSSSAVLTFWHKYNIVPGVNGAFLEVGYNDGSGMKYRYISPTVGSYTGSMYSGATRTDDFGNTITWAWNGVSKGGNFGWEFVKVNLLNYIPDAGLSDVRIKFNYTQYGGGTGYGWYIDDVTLKISREETYAPDSTCRDVWQLQDGDAHSGTHSWWNGDPTTGWMMPGVDNSLVSTSIDLTRARYAYFSAYLKFNINDQSGAPPDGFRIEVTKDNGVTWEAINLGARASWGVSGTDNTGTTSYTGHDAGGNWIEVGTLTRVMVDLSDWSGNVIHIRFRVVDTNGSTYAHYEDPNAGFGGFYVDDVMVTGETLST